MFATHTRVPHLHTMSTTQQNNVRQAIDREASLPSTLRRQRHNAGFIGVTILSTLHISRTLSFSSIIHKNKVGTVTQLLPMSELCPGRHAVGSSHHKLRKQRRTTLTGRTVRTKARGGCSTPRIHGGGERDAAPGPRTRGR